LTASAAWVLTGVAVLAPLWLVAGALWLAIGALGPLGVLAFKPGEQSTTKLIFAILISSPTVVGLAFVMWKWTSMRRWVRPLAVMGVSFVWHAIGLGLWLMIVGGLN
jgi:hypothetical protein